MNNKILLFTIYSLFHLSSHLFGSHKTLPPVPPRSARIQQHIEEETKAAIKYQKFLEKKDATDRLLQRAESEETKSTTLRSSKEEYTSSQIQEPVYICYENSASCVPTKKIICPEEWSNIMQEFHKSKNILAQSQQKEESKKKELLKAFDQKYCIYPTTEDPEPALETPPIEVQKPSTPISKNFNRKTFLKWGALIATTITFIAAYRIWKDRIIEILDNFIFGTADRIEP